MKIDEHLSQGKFYFYKKCYKRAKTQFVLAANLCVQAENNYSNLLSLYKENDLTSEAQHLRTERSKIQSLLVDANHYLFKIQSNPTIQPHQASTREAKRRFTANEDTASTQIATSHTVKKRVRKEKPSGSASADGKVLKIIDTDFLLISTTSHQFFLPPKRIAGTPRQPAQTNADMPELERPISSLSSSVDSQ